MKIDDRQIVFLLKRKKILELYIRLENEVRKDESTSFSFNDASKRY